MITKDTSTPQEQTKNASSGEAKWYVVNVYDICVTDRVCIYRVIFPQRSPSARHLVRMGGLVRTQQMDQSATAPTDTPENTARQVRLR